MKKHIFTLASLLALGTLSAQVRTVNSATNVSVTNSPAFIDASSNTTVNGSANVGKGLIFPRVDLSAMTAFPGVTAGIANSFPTRFDGMIVYNTASSGTAGVGATQGTLSPGYWYYENKSSSNTGGTWKPVSTATAAVANTASNGLTLSGNDVKLGGTLSQATDIATSGNNLSISGTGKMIIGNTTIPAGGTNAKVIIDNGTTTGALQIKDGSEGVGKVLTSNANGIATWANTGLGVPSTMYTWNNNSTVTQNFVNNTPYTFGPYTVNSTGWYQVVSRWFYFQNAASSADYGAGSAWVQLNTASTNAMDAASSTTIIAQPFEERKVLTGSESSTIMGGAVIYLQAGTNYYIHFTGIHASRPAEQRLF